MRHETRDCRRMLERLSSYIDRELDAATCDRLERHLRDCPPCVEFIKTLRKTVALVREAGRRGRVPPSARRGLAQKLKACSAVLRKR